jgi:hypothetical protein
MKRILLFILLLIGFNACRSNKDYLERADADKALQDAVKRINKNSNDENAVNAIPELYKNISKTHLSQIESLNKSGDVQRWDNIIGHYDDLQQAYNSIITSPPAFKLVTPVSYATQLAETKEGAAEAYYQLGLTELEKPGRDAAKRAYTYFKKSGKYVPDYKDSRQKADDAFENGMVNVLVNPVQDNSFFFNSGWGNYGYNYSNEYFQQNLVRELNSRNDRYPANFYTEYEARRDNVKPDWIVDLILRNLDVPMPVNNTYSRNVNAQVQSGTDTSGKPIYQTVYATVQVTRRSFTANAHLELNIKDLATRKTISYRNFREDYRWEQEEANYTGDSRALSSQDWQLINNTQSYVPRKEEVLNELYRKIYPDVLRNIRMAVEW